MAMQEWCFAPDR